MAASRSTAGVTAAERREILAAFEKALDRERHNLALWPELFWQQLHNRLQWAEGPERELAAAETERRADDVANPVWFRTRTRFREAEALLKTLRHEGVRTCAFSADGSRLCGAGLLVRLWDARTGHELGTAGGPDDAVVSCAFGSAGDCIVTGSAMGTVRIRDAETLAVRAELYVDEGEAHCAASPVESLAVVAAGATLRLIELPSGRELVSCKAEDGVFSCCAFSAKDLIVTGDDQGTLRLWAWSPTSLTEKRCVTHAHSGPVKGCEVSPNFGFMATAGDDVLKVWGFDDDGKIRASSLTQFAPVNDCAISADSGFLASASDDRTAWVRPVGVWPAPVSILEGHGGAVAACTFPAMGAPVLATAGRDDTVRLWDPSRPRSLSGVVGHHERITAVAFAPDGSFVVSASTDMTLKTWGSATTDELRTFEGHMGPVWDCLVMMGSALIASAAGDGTIRVWDSQSGRQTKKMDVGEVVDVHGLDYSPDGYTLAAGHGDEISLWDIATGECTGRAAVGESHQRDWVQDCAFTHDGTQLLVACKDQTLRLWDVVEWRELVVLRGHTDTVSCCAAIPEGRLAVSGSMDGTLRLWDLDLEECLHVFEGHTDAVWDCALGAGDDVLVSAGWDGTVRIWHVPSRVPVATLRAPEQLRSVALCSSELRIACGDMHGWPRIVDVVGLRPEPPWPAEHGDVHAVL